MIRISNSQINLFRGCPRRWAHKYVLHTTPDSVEEQHTFFYGKILHKILELHIIANTQDLNFVELPYDKNLQFNTFFTQALASVEKEHDSLVRETKYNEENGDFALRCKMYFHYVCFCKFIQFNPEIVIKASEHTIETETCKLVIDLVFELGNKFYILDFKTTSTKKEKSNTDTRLHFDSQLQLYALYQDTIKKNLGLTSTFGGIGYLEFVKPTNKWLVKLEKINNFEERCIDYIAYLIAQNDYEASCYATIVDSKELNFDDFRNNFLITYKEMEMLAETCANASFFGVQNTNNCNNYNRPCEFWSQCYGNKKHPQTSKNLATLLNPAQTLLDSFLADIL